MNPQINPRVNTFETLHVDSKKISCDGGKGASGHPKVYLNMGKNDSIVCPYCSKNFVFEKPSVTAPSKNNH